MARRPDPTRRSGWRNLGRDRRGNVALLFAFLSVPMLMLGGAAVDYGFATRLETKLQAATDATALLLCQTPLTTSAADLNLLAQTTMIGAMGAPNLVVDPLTITANPRQITLSAHKVSTAFFGKITGTTRINPGATAQCATPLPKTFEIALVLDNTGSMAESSGGQSKLQAVQTAATNFVNYVYTSTAFSSATKIAIVPFAGAVAVNPTTYRYATWIDQTGQSSYHWTNVLSPGASGFTSRFDIFAKLQSAYSGWGWAGCLESLPYPLNVQDGAPTAGNRDSYYVPLLAPDEPGDASKSYGTFSVNKSTTYYSYNSYIDDDNSSAIGTCAIQANGTSYNAALGRACKYVSPRNAVQSSYVGIPNGPNFGCTTQPLLRLTSDTAALKTLISNMAPLGSTNIHEGFMWGWRTLSPKSVFADGSAYASSANSSNATTINKIIILMTDGTNSWTANPYAPNGSLYFAAGYFQNANGTSANPRLPPTNQNIADSNGARTALDALTAQACTNAKAVNISVYTIGFSVPSDPIDATGQALLKNCASSANQYFLANTADDLIKAFQQIQASIGALRLTQ
jgi:Flp pilus assembly protein TadG